MGRFRKWAAALCSVALVFGFVQCVGGYLVGQLSSFQDTGQVMEPQVEERVVRQLVLQLEPAEYYTFQLGAYEDASAGQARINQLAQLGYRVSVSEGPPFQLWLGCLGREPEIGELPEELRREGDVFVQRRILNETALRFPADENRLMEQVAALLTSYDVVLKHSLSMFQDYHYAACSEENWAGMVEQITGELTVIEETADALLSDDADEPLAKGLLDLRAATEEYGESLARMQEKKSDKVVLLAQSCLLDFIGAYHGFIAQQNQQM